MSKRNGVLCLFAVVFALAYSSSGQTTTGTPPYQSFAGGPDVINLGNLNVHYSMPVFRRAGRGISFDYALAYDSSVWKIASSAWTPASTTWGLTRDTAAAVGYIQLSSNTYCITIDPGIRYNFSNYVDSAGTLHHFVASAERLTDCHAETTQTVQLTDGSGITINVTATPSATVKLTSGEVIVPALGAPSVAGNRIDSNGNEITSTVNGSVTTFYDTLSTTTPVLTIDSTNPASVLYKYTNPAGTTATVTVSYVARTVQTMFQCSGINEYGPISNSLPDKITLPDGSYYQFSYEPTTMGSGNVTGRIASMRLPTGGTISYTYTGGNNGKGILCSDGSTAGFQRTTPDTPSGQNWSYVRTGTSPSYTTTVTSPPDPTTAQSNVTSITFQTAGGGTNGGNFETSRMVYQGAATGTPLETTYTCYNGNGVATPSSCSTLAITTPFSRITRFRQLNGGALAEVDTSYDGYGSVTESDAYDFGASTPTRKTSILYGSYNSGTDTCAALGNGIVGKPCKVTVTDGGNNLKAKTTYSYDETTPLTSGITTNHVSVTGSRGNLTTARTYSNSSSALIRTFINYDTGTVSQVQDVNGQSTTYTYGACAGAYVTNVSLPLSLARSMTWNCTGGVATSSTDENGKTSYVNYTTDPNFWRPESTKDQLQNITNLSYASLTQSRGHLDFNGTTSTVDVTSTLDSLGRAMYSQQRQGQSSSNYDTVQTAYDSFGRPFQSTIPYVATTTNNPTPPQGTPVTNAYYDAMGRPIQTIDSGGGTVNITYNQNDVYQEVAPAPTVPPAPASENTKRKQLEYDGLGRLKSVCEITSEATYSGTCSQTNSQTGYLTNYVYDLAPNYNSLQVTQNAQRGTSQTRLYVYDMLGRLTSETNPETANLAYAYVYDSDATCGTYNGDLVKRTDAKGNVTCYAYDALHRVTSVTYPSGPNSSSTAKKYFVYDSATVNGVTMTNAKGRLAEAYTCTTCPGTKITDLGYTYSARGEVTDAYESTAHSSGYYHLTASYFAHGALNALSGVPSLPTIYYGGNNDSSGLDGEGRYLKVTASAGTNPATGVTYTNSGTTQPIGSLTQTILGSGDNDTFSYDRNTGRLTQYNFNIGATPQTVQGNLTWSANGTLAKLAITDPFNSLNNQTCTFGYDDLARINSANCGTPWSQTFSRDPFGNASKSGSVTFTPGFDQTKNWFLPVTGFDNNGNLLSDVTHTYSWDAENKLTAVDTVSLTFDALGRMVEQARGSSYTQIVYSPTGGKLALMNGQTLQKAFCPLPGGATAVYGSSGTIAYYRHTDWLGSSRFASTPSRTKYFDAAYAPYGEDYADSGTTDLNFTGQNQDTVSGLYDFLYREYHPNSGRWIQPDPAGLAVVSMANPQTWNRYAYVGNMPPNTFDSLGLGIGGGADVFGNHTNDGLAGTDEFDLAAMGILPIGGEAGFCPAEFTGCKRTNGGTLGIRFDGSVSPFIFGEIVLGENGDAYLSGLEVSTQRISPCQSHSYRIPMKLQQAMVRASGFTVDSISLSDRGGEVTGAVLGNINGMNFPGGAYTTPRTMLNIQYEGNGVLSVGTSPGGSMNYNLPYGGSASVTYLEYNTRVGQFTSVAGSVNFGPASLPASRLMKSFLNSGNQQSVRDAFDAITNYFGKCDLL